MCLGRAFGGGLLRALCVDLGRHMGDKGAPRFGAYGRKYEGSQTCEARLSKFVSILFPAFPAYLLAYQYSSSTQSGNGVSAPGNFFVQSNTFLFTYILSSYDDIVSLFL